MHQLIDRWREIALDGNSFKLSEDDIQGVEYSSYAGFIKSKDLGKASADFHLGLIPQPYIGNMATAKVFLLMLNPGFSAGDYYAQENSAAFKKARIDNLRQENGDDDYPFFYLNPEFAWTAGGKWWQDKLASVTKKLATHEKLGKDEATAYQQALRHISKNLACIELCPYFSKVYKEPKTKLASINLAHEYVGNELAERCKRGAASAVLLRQAGIWGLEESKNIFRLNPKHARGAHLTTGTEVELSADTGYIRKAGDFVYDKLAALLP